MSEYRTKKIQGKNPEVLLSVKGLHLRYSSGKNWLGKEKQWVDAIKDINFEVYQGETLGIVGESGSGKTTLGRALLGLNQPTQGSISYGGIELLKMTKAELLSFQKKYSDRISGSLFFTESQINGRSGNFRTA